CTSSWGGGVCAGFVGVAPRADPLQIGGRCRYCFRLCGHERHPVSSLLTMRVYDLEQGRSVERLDGHARIKPLPTKLFIPGRRVFTPRYRLFIPSSTNLPP